MTEQEMIPALAADVCEQMTAMVTGHWVSQMVRAVVDLSLADHLSGQRLTAAEVAEREGSAPNTTFRLMRACVALGLLTADADGRFTGTPIAADFGQGHPWLAAGSGIGHHAAIAMAAVERAHHGGANRA